MTKFGQVISVEDASGTVTVQYVRPDACEKCGACGTKPHHGTITLAGDCAPGDWVRVELPDGRFLHATAVTYGVPLLLFFIGLFSGYQLFGQSEPAALAGCLIGLFIGLGLLRLVDKRVSGKPEWTPRITAVYKSKPSLDDIGCGGQAS